MALGRGSTYGGPPQNLPLGDLPTYGDIAGCFWKAASQEKLFKGQVKFVEKQLIAVWEQCAPTMLARCNTFKRLKHFLVNVRGTSYSRKLSQAQWSELDFMQGKLFDISFCKCDLPAAECTHPRIDCHAQNCNKTHILCICDNARKIPEEELSYMRDRRSKTGTFRGMFKIARPKKPSRSVAKKLRLGRGSNQKAKNGPGAERLQDEKTGIQANGIHAEDEEQQAACCPHLKDEVDQLGEVPAGRLEQGAAVYIKEEPLEVETKAVIYPPLQDEKADQAFSCGSVMCKIEDTEPGTDIPVLCSEPEDPLDSSSGWGKSARRSRKQAIHTKEEPISYSCSLCKRLFIDIPSLYNHLAVHKKEQTQQALKDKLFQCSACKKAFSSQGNLDKHKARVHETKKHFACFFCEKTFFAKSGLVIHMRTHTGEKPYSCSFCGRAFANSNALTTHSRRFHPE